MRPMALLSGLRLQAGLPISVGSFCVLLSQDAASSNTLPGLYHLPLLRHLISLNSSQEWKARSNSNAYRPIPVSGWMMASVSRINLIPVSRVNCFGSSVSEALLPLDHVRYRPATHASVGPWRSSFRGSRASSETDVNLSSRSHEILRLPVLTCAVASDSMPNHPAGISAQRN